MLILKNMPYFTTNIHLIKHDKFYFIDYYIDKLYEMDYPETKIQGFMEYGNVLWKRVEKLPKGFCHGDLHTGNIILTSSGKYMILDFDLACNAFPIFDFMTICDRTDYFNFEPEGYEKVTDMINRFCTGYTKICNISNDEIHSIYDFIAIRHYQLQAQIIEVYGPKCVDEAFIDNQYDWLMKWCEQCGI